MLQRWAIYLQKQTTQLNRAALLTVFILFTALGCGACFLVVYRALHHPAPLHRLFPMTTDSILIK